MPGFLDLKKTHIRYAISDFTNARDVEPAFGSGDYKGRRGNRRAFSATQITADAASKRSNVSFERSAAIYARDSYTCRYCGRRSFALPVLNAIATLVPDALPLDPGTWKAHLTEFVFSNLAASVDHVRPVTRGGAETPDNLVTAVGFAIPQSRITS
ncbi:MAG: hypothetical protein JO165_00800 [Candidatus Eremiobacteraeota bacterium]|nr:hypothetical protein [Candidatus Eremiobacteraeota bacterium]